MRICSEQAHNKERNTVSSTTVAVMMDKTSGITLPCGVFNLVENCSVLQQVLVYSFIILIHDSFEQTLQRFVVFPVFAEH